ncbi:MAG TPA: RraA family protein [Bacillota bacterium]|nr:RraA family protein [Bacillota bacterium]
MFTIGERPAKVPGIDEALAALRKVGTATLGHLTDFGFAPGLHPFKRPAKVVGLAYTVHIPRLDSSALHYALGQIQPGEVIVVDTTGESMRSPWGGGVTYAAKRAGAAGAVVDGVLTDWEELMSYGLDVWSRGFTSLTTRGLGLEGALQVPVQIAGVVVKPGDVVFADSDGIFFLNPADAGEIAARLAAMEAREPETRRRIDAGEKLGDISGAVKKMDALRDPSRPKP